MTFKDAINAGHAVVVPVFSNLVSSDTDNYPHAVIIHKIIGTFYRIKNSVYNQKSIDISQKLPAYDTFYQNQQLFRQRNPTITDDDYITFRQGIAFQFKDNCKLKDIKYIIDALLKWW